MTVPFKLECLAFADAVSARAQIAGAANTLAWRDGRWFADNTDGAGLEADLTRNLGAVVHGRAVLVLGAGGAARGILAPLLAHGPRRLVVANRTHDKAVQLVESFAARADRAPTLEACPLDRLEGRRFDIVINATSASLSGSHADLHLPDRLFADDALAYDLMYAAQPTSFLHWAGAHGAARCADGLGMLVEQAALQFQLWRGVLPATGPVLAQLRAELKR